jgi:ATP-dependent DNA helicase PIF1
VIDEISMMDVSLFIRVGKAVGNIRYKYGKCKEAIPFGGIRLIVVGDFYQIAPIQSHVEEVDEDGEIVRKTYTYLFQHPIWQELAFKPIVLTKPMRYIKDGVVDEEGIKFASILADVRKGLLS